MARPRPADSRTRRASLRERSIQPKPRVRSKVRSKVKTPPRRPELVHIADQLLTTDPCIAAQSYELADFGWRFPEGAHWKVTPANVQLWDASGFFGSLWDMSGVTSLGPLDNDPMAILRLDRMAFDRYGDRGPLRTPFYERLAAYLLPGREDWGCATPPEDDPAEDPEEWSDEEGW